MLKRLAPAFVILALTACTENTGILPLGADAYTISVHKAPIIGGGNAAEATALTQANQFCTTHGRKFLATKADLSSPPIQFIYGPTSYSLTFECLKPGDPRLRAPRTIETPGPVLEAHIN